MTSEARTNESSTSIHNLNRNVISDGKDAMKEFLVSQAQPYSCSTIPALQSQSQPQPEFQAPISNVFNDDESEVSEEDPDDYIPARSLIQAISQPPGAESAGAAEISDKVEDELSAQLEEALAGDLEEDKSQVTSKITQAPAVLVSKKPKPTFIRVYEVSKIETTFTYGGDNEDETEEFTTTINKFTNLDEANIFAAHELSDLARSISSNSTQQIYRHCLFYGQLYRSETQSVAIQVAYTVMNPDQITNRDGTLDYETDIKPLFQHYMFAISFATTTKGADGVIREKSQALVTQNLFTEVELANREACRYLTEYLKPKSSNIDEVIIHSDAARQILDARNGFDRDKECMNVELELEDNSLPWLMKEGVLSISVVVQKMKVDGPLN
jgi:hypothetical protein